MNKIKNKPDIINILANLISFSTDLFNLILDFRIVLNVKKFKVFININGSIDLKIEYSNVTVTSTNADLKHVLLEFFICKTLNALGKLEIVINTAINKKQRIW